MRRLNIDPGPAAYWADLLLYGATLICMGLALLTRPADIRLIGWMAVGAATWTLLEYLLHRFVLHGLSPFKQWHAEHHRRPEACIAAPTLLTVSLFTTLLLPVFWWLDLWPAIALGFGMLGGYFGYAIVHHTLHQPHRPLGARPQRSRLRRQRRWHARHHRRMSPAPADLGGSQTPGHYGVTSAFWDIVFRTGDRQA